MILNHFYLLGPMLVDYHNFVGFLGRNLKFMGTGKPRNP